MKNYFQKKGIWTSENFKQYVLSQATNKKSKFNPAKMDKVILPRRMTDQEIQSEYETGLMTADEILKTIEYYTKKQSNGEEGFLLTSGYWNIVGYLKCDDGVVRAVGVGWGSGGREWHCYCNGLGYWFAGPGVLVKQQKTQKISSPSDPSILERLKKLEAKMLKIEKIINI